MTPRAISIIFLILAGFFLVLGLLSLISYWNEDSQSPTFLFCCIAIFFVCAIPVISHLKPTKTDDQ